MAAVLSFSSGANWFVNGWGWRTLLERAIQDAAGQPEAAELETYLHSQGLDFADLDRSARVRLAAVLARSATALHTQYRTSKDTYEAGYTTALRDLLPLLTAESGVNAS